MWSAEISSSCTSTSQPQLQTFAWRSLQLLCSSTGFHQLRHNSALERTNHLQYSFIIASGILVRYSLIAWRICREYSARRGRNYCAQSASRRRDNRAGLTIKATTNAATTTTAEPAINFAMAASVEDLLREENCIRVFGYGSLIWKPDFDFDQQYMGYIEGYERRFWQGSTHHRGTVDRPGRCLTLTKVPNVSISLHP